MGELEKVRDGARLVGGAMQGGERKRRGRWVERPDLHALASDRANRGRQQGDSEARADAPEDGERAHGLVNDGRHKTESASRPVRGVVQERVCGARPEDELFAGDAAKGVEPVVLELGGKSANVILDDADLNHAVETGMKSAFNNAGQMCGAWTRMVVPRARMREVTDRAVAIAASYVVGDPRDERTTIGPIVSAAQQDSIVGDADAVRIVNDSVYGLRGVVFSETPRALLRVAGQIRAGEVDIDGNELTIEIPFGGYKQSATVAVRGSSASRSSSRSSRSSGDHERPDQQPEPAWRQLPSSRGSAG
jgi:hypothetical protein